MSKQQRHERRKTDRARRLRVLGRHPTSHIKHGATALAAAAAIASGTVAYASPVRFDNPAAGPGHFDWNTSAGHEVLDILADSAGQPGSDASVPGTFSMLAGYYGNRIKGQYGGLGEIQRFDTVVNFVLPGIDAGVEIPAAFPWGVTAYITSSNGQYTALIEGQSTYLGVRFDPGDGLHYGWIGVVRTGMDLDSFAWGYETEPGVAIPAGIPEPSTLALLAFGAVLAKRRRA